MWLENTCVNITLQEWESYMKGSKPINYEWLKRKIKKHLPTLYNDLCLDYPNPYASHSRVTKTHYILVHSAIEYFINKK
jgi:hypothetical protein